MSRLLLAERSRGGYFNWDDVEFRRRWTKNPRTVLPELSPDTPLLVLDEIHKARDWKRTLKGVYDTLPGPVDILVTGSARLNVCRKGGDSLTGRYLHFRLHPFTLREMSTADTPGPDEVQASLSADRGPTPRAVEESCSALLRFGGFPEPLFAQNDRRARLWRRNHVDTVIREDLRDLTRIPDLSRVEMLAALLPERVGSLFSQAALRDDLMVSFDTVRRWIAVLKNLYYFYEIKPYRRGIARSIRKEGKIYLWDHGEVPEEAARFENLVANHLVTACQRWTDSGEGDFDLCFLRNKEKQEIDFLLVRDGRPWLPVEVKLRDTNPSPNWRKFLPTISCPTALQLVSTPGVWSRHDIGSTRLVVASASGILSQFP